MIHQEQQGLCLCTPLPLHFSNQCFRFPLCLLIVPGQNVICSGFFKAIYSGIHVQIDQQTEQTNKQLCSLLPLCSQGANGLKVTMGSNGELDKKLHSLCSLLRTINLELFTKCNKRLQGIVSMKFGSINQVSIEMLLWESVIVKWGDLVIKGWACQENKKRRIKESMAHPLPHWSKLSPISQDDSRSAGSKLFV